VPVVEKRHCVAVKILIATSSGAACAEINDVNRLQDVGLVRNETFCQPLDIFQTKDQMGPICALFTLWLDHGFLIFPNF